MKIQNLDTIYCKTNQPSLLRVKELSFKKSYWRKGAGFFGKGEQQYDSYLVERNGTFLAGLLPRIIQYCYDKQIEVEIDDLEISITPTAITPVITLSTDQQRLVSIALSKTRGVIKSPTGSGKTVMAAAIMSAFPNARILFLCHTISLLKQTKEELDRFKVGPSSIISGTKKDTTGRIIISTIQSFSKEDMLHNMHNKIDIVIVDECHRISALKPKAGYYKTLTSLVAPIKYGFTATIQNELEAKFALEGLIGPVIGETSLQQGIKNELLATPKVKLIAVPPLDLKEIRGYQNIYQSAIVEYRRRNRLIIETAKELNDKGKSVLIYVNKIEHGERLLDIAERMNFNLSFIRGETEGQERENARKALNDKKIMAVVATVVWKEGINIRSLDSIMLAGGGKKELTVIQSIGRGFRRTEEKTEVLFIDFLDQGRYLSEHCVARLSIYSQNGWL